MPAPPVTRLVLPPIPTITRRAPLALVASINSPVPRVVSCVGLGVCSDQDQPRGRRHFDHGRSTIAQHAEGRRTGLPSGSVTTAS